MGTGSWCPGEPAVAGEQGGVHRFGECHVGRVIDGEVSVVPSIGGQAVRCPPGGRRGGSSSARPTRRMLRPTRRMLRPPLSSVVAGPT